MQERLTLKIKREVIQCRRKLIDHIPNKSTSSIPVGLLKERNPLGHSGHRRLQDVVGSKAILIGRPLIVGIPRQRE